MKGIALNDFINLKRTMLFGLIFVLCFGLPMVFVGDFKSGSLVFVFVLAVGNFSGFGLGSLGLDENNGFFEYLKSLPISAKEYVEVKFLYTLIPTTFWLILALVYLYSIKRLEFIGILLFIGTMYFVSNVFSIYGVLKFGNKTWIRYIPLALWLIFFGITGFGQAEISEVLINGTSNMAIYGICIVAFVASYIVFKKMSIDAMKEKGYE